MRELLAKRTARLLCVKSLVTLCLTAVFAYMAVMGTIREEGRLYRLMVF